MFFFFYVYTCVLSSSLTALGEVFVSSPASERKRELVLAEPGCDTIHQPRIVMDRLSEGWCRGERVERPQELVCPEHFQTVPTGLSDCSGQNQQALSASQARRK